MLKNYTVERNVQILIDLLKQHNVKKVIVSPGTTNVCFVASIQQDTFFEIYSCVDERSAAYMACGLAAESGEPVVLSCTGATASRNYMPALTEAYYRKLPILAVTSMQHSARIGHNIPQAIDRSVMPNDTVKYSVELKVMRDNDDLWGCNVAVNKALLLLKDKNPGPVHINLITTYHQDFSTDSLPRQRVINKIYSDDHFPKITEKKVVIFVAEHIEWNKELTIAVEKFCEKYNAVVLYDHTGKYKGEYGILPNLLLSVDQPSPFSEIDLMISIGNVSGAYLPLTPKTVWRVNHDGEIRDTYRTLRYVFEMKEEMFFTKYCELSEANNLSYYHQWKEADEKIRKLVPDLPFSNPWIAQRTIAHLPKNSVLHLGILNSLRSWNFFEADKSITVYSNTGGFGIDGCVSTLIGASLANTDKLFFGVVGDLAFFYDMNSLGNRHISNNLRLIVVNNGKGTEFRHYNHFAAKFDESADTFIAAAGHFGNKSSLLIKNYSENLGFEYISASSKQEFDKVLDDFVFSQKKNQSIIFEVFTNNEDESNALKKINFMSTNGS